MTEDPNSDIQMSEPDNSASDQQKTKDDNPDSAGLQEEEPTDQQVKSQSGSSESLEHVNDSVDQGVERALQSDRDLVLAQLQAFEKESSKVLKWKEELKLFHLDAVVNLTYYELWKNESNNWFRRVAILQRRHRKIKESKGGS